MTEYQDMIRQYKESCSQIYRRIEELNGQIASQDPLCERESVPTLQKRRYLLYSELAEMEDAMRQIEDYLAATHAILTRTE